MGEVIKAAAISAVCAVMVVLIKKYIPEYAPFAQIAAMIAVFFSILNVAQSVIYYFSDFISSGVIDAGYAMLLFKALGIAIIAQFGAEMCRDSDNSALAFALETAAKIAIIAMSLPMFKNLADITAGLLKG
ncbi:MAG: stage III sporulation AC/AD family protein [Clostridia bacterium]|nr:stage III sporulation AC/AD family protein [Clostridia bacterium]